MLTLTFKVAQQGGKQIEWEKRPVGEWKVTIDTAIDGSSTEGVMTITMHLAGSGTEQRPEGKYTHEISSEIVGKTVWSAEK